MSTLPNYLPGTVVAGLQDDALEDFLQTWLVGVSGLAAQYVRPAFQADPPPIPDSGITWLAFNIKAGKEDWDPFISKDETLMFRVEELNVACTFYGPLAATVAMQVRMNANVGLNRAALQQGSMSYIGSGVPVKVSEKIKGRYQRRIDQELTLRRTVQFSYAVQSILSATGTISSDTTPVPIAVNPPV